MAEVNFGAGQTPVEAPPVDATPLTQAVAVTPQNTAVAQNTPLLGDTVPSFSDIILPRLNIVQNIGAMKESFNPGELVFNQQVPLFTPQKINASTGNVVVQASPPVIITVLGFKPMRYTEKVAGGARGMIVSSEAEVRSAGGTLDWAEWNLKKASGMKRFEPLADALVLIQRPVCAVPKQNPDNDPTFVYDVEGQKYALAFWALRGTSFTAAYKRVLAPAKLTGCLRQGGYPSWSFALSTKEETYDNGNKAWVPVVLPNSPSTPAMLAFAKSVLHPEQAESGQQ